MHTGIKIVFTTLALAVTSLAANAQAPATPRVDQREANQQARIAEGAATGQLKPRETQRLEKQQAAIDGAQAKAKSDGVVTKKERAKLHAMQDKSSRTIKRQKHDAQTAG